MSLTELIQKIHELSPEDQEIVRRELDGLQERELEETPEMLAAIDEGLRSLREEPTTTLEELRKEMLTWTTDSK
jgi:thioesterase domain-containing protein